VYDQNSPKQTTSFQRHIFQTGSYVEHFTPDDNRNPFSKIYKKKKLDTIEIINKFSHPKSILDIGGGMGRVSLALAKSPLNEVVLSDISTDMLKIASNSPDRLTKMKLVNGDAHHLPFSDDSFHFVVALDLFCHLENPKGALLEFYRVLKKDGLLILDSTNSNPLWAFFYPRYLGKNPWKWLKIIKFGGVLPGWEHIVKHYPKKTFFSFLTEIGFQILRTIDYGPSLCPKWHLVVTTKTF
jgi:ubiquinone/menaquinone biosynthesis C-methylase UbiE